MKPQIFLLAACFCAPLSTVAKPVTSSRHEDLNAQLLESLRHLRQDKGIELLRQGADPNAYNGKLFRWALASGQLPLVREFLSRGAKVTSSALASAVRSEGNSSTVATLLLNRGANPNATASYQAFDDEGERMGKAEAHTMLMMATEAGNTAVAKLLVARGARINTRLPNGLTALRIAARIGNKELCEFFLAHQASFAGAEKDLLQTAVAHNDVPFLERLEKRGALPRPVRWPLSIDHLSLPMAQKLVALGANPDGNGNTQYSRYTPLRLATYQEDLPLARFLLDKGAHVDASILNAAIPGRLASRVEQQQMEEAARNDPFGETEAPAQVQKPEDTRLLQLFLERGANPNLVAARRRRETALHLAASANRVGAVRLLLQHGANLEARDTYGQTPLMWALESRCDRTVPLLLAAGASVTSRDKEGMTPLLSLLHSGGVTVIYAPLAVATPPHDPVLPFAQQLVAHGANVWAQNNDGETALHLAASQGYVQVAKLLLSHGAILETPNKRGNTPLAYACFSGQFPVAKLLFEHGANPDVRDNQGKTPRQIAQEPFTMRFEVVGRGKLALLEQKRNAPVIESFSAPIRTGRRQIAKLFSGSTPHPLSQ